MTIEPRYPSLLHLPGMATDRHGNMNLNTAPKGKGLRYRHDYAISLDPVLLKGVILSELLNWMRWGSQSGVMWECTLKELVQLIGHWEKANSEKALYGIRGNDKREYWDQLFSKACMTGISPGYICPICKTPNLDTTLWDCKKCGFHCFPSFTRKDIFIGNRGPNSYDLALEGADGLEVANAAYFTRGEKRLIKVSGREYMF